jgi:hypothetical protein
MESSIEIYFCTTILHDFYFPSWIFETLVLHVKIEFYCFHGVRQVCKMRVTGDASIIIVNFDQSPVKRQFSRLT